jgi:hypothetical protein
MAYTPIDKSNDYFNTVLYTGTSASNAITVGFKPDLVWIKWRDGSNNHKLQDAIRGITKAISSNTTGAEVTDSPSITSFDTNGFTLGNDGGDYNYTGRTYASWNWLGANTTVSNTSGSITSTVSANTTSGFSIVSYTGNGTGNSTIGHGLGAIPKFIIVKNRSATGSWGTKNPAYNSPADPKVLYFDTGAADSSQNVWGTSASFTTLTFTVGDWSGSNTSSQNYIAYCFADVKGYSKFGSYTGNGSADGTFVYTGFKPAFVMVKAFSTTGYWVMKDNKRTNSFNVVDGNLYAQINSAEDTGAVAYMDFLSNGFKMRGNYAGINGSGVSYIYMAFAENPFVTSTGIPTPAR